MAAPEPLTFVPVVFCARDDDCPQRWATPGAEAAPHAILDEALAGSLGHQSRFLIGQVILVIQRRPKTHEGASSIASSVEMASQSSNSITISCSKARTSRITLIDAEISCL